MKNTDIGIVAYGAYIPSFLIKTAEISHQNGLADVGKSLGLSSKSVPDVDEDTATISLESAIQAVERAENNGFKRKDIEALFVGSESHPYAVKPTGTIVSTALGLGEKMSMADLEFACKAGTQSLQICLAYVKSRMAKLGLAIGADVAQAKPKDALEYTAGAGGAAFIIGSKNVLVKLISTYSVATDTPDFWRRPNQSFPEHAGRFSGDPAYFYHIEKSVKGILAESKMEPSDFDYCIFHTPNGKFPNLIAKKLGFSEKQLNNSLLVESIGNLYAGSSMVSMVGVLDKAKNKDKILMVSYGSGSGSDSFIWQCANDFEEKTKGFNKLVRQQIKNNFVSYMDYFQRIEV